ncbi:Leucine Rich Repeat domain-containing protein [Cordyceps javanica]|uniref:Leucine Rich Repeat domain-containing protein n=1 Tax=Cordyceps javanica TaxID=43265 RepID=A0A545VPC1_9HYPO|nr:Leucine Rich Repeat domain-containing protein [Cordyceps javanica]TQW03561.1 Leucine Rich Repeat domain protein [Cordyceps javanica]
MTSLPSYQEATARADWLGFAAPYIHSADYHALCLVNRHFWKVFAPRLWIDILATARRCGLPPDDDLIWWFDFAFVKLGDVRLSTRGLARILDLRDFANECYQFATDQNSRFLHSLHMALKLLPGINVLLLDNHTEIDPNSLVNLAKTHSSPLLLSISHCSTQLPGTFFTSTSLQKLVYLDISNLPGSVTSMLQPSLLPDLRILKLACRELDDATFVGLAELYRLRLWSLDLSHNRLTDSILQPLVERCFPATSLRSPAHFQVEGKLWASGYGTAIHGPFEFIDESPFSGSFSSRERYHLDAPTYDAQPCLLHGHRQVFRSDGRSALRSDSVDGATRVLSHQSTNYHVEDAYRNSRGITHLNISYNQLSASGVEKLLRTSNGQIEYFACDSTPIVPPHSSSLEFWPSGSLLHGVVGLSHVFRPVYSPNLRSLRIHHSLVTNIPTLTADGFSALARLYIAETCILFRVDKAYPQRFVPDMNPRLSSLTLTCIPRRSVGPLIERLLHFLKLLSIQERAIFEVKNSAGASSWRSPGILRGLRRLRLEFEPDNPGKDTAGGEDLDAEQLMNSGEKGFSFFEDESLHSTRPALEAGSRSARRLGTDGTRATNVGAEPSRNNKEFRTYRDEWNGCGFELQVWAGPLQPDSNPIINEYRRLVLNHDSLCEGVGPASPDQVLAGVPEKSYVFHTAWRAALMPPGELPVPALQDVTGMRDVLGALKEHRATGRAHYEDLQCNRKDGTIRAPPGAPHFFWTGSVEVST